MRPALQAGRRWVGGRLDGRGTEGRGRSTGSGAAAAISRRLEDAALPHLHPLPLLPPPPTPTPTPTPHPPTQLHAVVVALAPRPLQLGEQPRPRVLEVALHRVVDARRRCVVAPLQVGHRGIDGGLEVRVLGVHQQPHVGLRGGSTWGYFSAALLRHGRWGRRRGGGRGCIPAMLLACAETQAPRMHAWVRCVRGCGASCLRRRLRQAVHPCHHVAHQHQLLVAQRSLCSRPQPGRKTVN